MGYCQGINHWGKFVINRPSNSSPTTHRRILTIVTAAIGFGLSACGGTAETTSEQATPSDGALPVSEAPDDNKDDSENVAAKVKSAQIENLAPADWADAAAAFHNPDGRNIGKILLKEAPIGVLLRIDLRTVAEGWHGIHLHNVADCSDGAAGFKLSGGHIDPDDNEHGLLNPQGAEAADMPNIYANVDGSATAEIYNGFVTLSGNERNALIDGDGFAVIIHKNADDHVSQPIGGAGARIACAAITGTN